MNTTHIITLEAVSTFPCKKDDGTYYTSKKVEKGSQITLNVPSVVTGIAIFTQPDDSKYIKDIISQFYKKDLMITKEQLVSGYWKIIEES